MGPADHGRKPLEQNKELSPHSVTGAESGLTPHQYDNYSAATIFLPYLSCQGSERSPNFSPPQVGSTACSISYGKAQGWSPLSPTEPAPAFAATPGQLTFSWHGKQGSLPDLAEGQMTRPPSPLSLPALLGLPRDVVSSGREMPGGQQVFILAFLFWDNGKTQ